MNKIMLGNHLIYPDEIVKIEEKTVRFSVEVPSKKQKKGLLSSIFGSYDIEKVDLFCLIVSVHSDAPDDGFPHNLYTNFTIYNDVRFKEYVKKGFVNGKEIGMQTHPLINDKWDEPDYPDTNMEYDPDIHSKHDFVKKYLE